MRAMDAGPRPWLLFSLLLVTVVSAQQSGSPSSGPRPSFYHMKLSDGDGNELCGIDASIPRFNCVLTPTIADGGKLKRFGAGAGREAA